MDQVFVIRHKVLVEGLSRRRVAREMGVSRNTVDRYLNGAEPCVRRAALRSRPKRDLVVPRIEALLESSTAWTAGKQQLTAARVHAMLRGEGFEVGETLVKVAVREWRRRRREVFVPLDYPPGDLAEVDFFEVLVDLGDARRKAFLFVMRLMFSGRDFAWIYERQDQAAFFDGHVRAFVHFGAVPHRIAYDNLKPAVARVLAGSDRELNPRFAALCNHYLFEPCFARVRTGHDKGGVEARGKLIRWQHLVPIPRGESLAGVSAELLARLDAQARERVDAEGKSTEQRFSVERAQMLGLPQLGFRAAMVELCSASRRALVRVGGATYSVPSQWSGLDLTAYVGVDVVELRGPDGAVVHRRQRRGGRSVLYRHYLRELAKKPQAMRQVAHRLVPELGEPFTRVWQELVDAAGPKRAAQIFARILERVVTQGETWVRERLLASQSSGEPPLLALATPAPATVVAREALPESLRDLDVAAASAADFDALLGGAR